MQKHNVKNEDGLLDCSCGGKLLEIKFLLLCLFRRIDENIEMK